MNMRRIIVVLFLILSANGFAQDLHFSQIMNSPLNINPASTGFSSNQFRFYLNHRNQWTSVTVPFLTYSASADLYLLKRRHKADLFGFGIVANKDQAGDSKFGTTQAGISLSYIRAITSNNLNILSFGANISFAQRSIDYTKLYFGNQFNGMVFDPHLASSEYFTVNNFTFLDVSAGVQMLNIFSEAFSLNSGFSAWHLNRPNQSLMANDEVKMEVKFILHSEASIELNNDYVLFPALYIMQQGKFNEALLGARIKHLSNRGSKGIIALQTGFFFRNRDAIVLHLGVDFKNICLVGSYDFNISKLHASSNYLGGMELSLQLLLNKRSAKKIKELPCPIF